MTMSAIKMRIIIQTGIVMHMIAKGLKVILTPRDQKVRKVNPDRQVHRAPPIRFKIPAHSFKRKIVRGGRNAA